MDQNLIYAKTPIGDEAVRQSTRVVQRSLRMVLVQVDGKLNVSELATKIGDQRLVETALRELEEGGFIAPTLEAVSVWQESKQRAQRLKSLGLPRQSPDVQQSGSTSETRTDPSAGSNFSSFGKPILAKSSGGDKAAPMPADLVEPIRLRSRRIALLGGFVAIVGVALLILLFFPYDRFKPQIEAELTRIWQTPVSVGEVRLSLVPQPVLRLSRVQITGPGDSVIYEIRIFSPWSLLGSGVRILPRVEVAGGRLAADQLVGLPMLRQAESGKSVALVIRKLLIQRMAVTAGTLALSDLGGEVRFRNDGQVENVALQSVDRSLRIEAEPTAQGPLLKVEGLGWRPSEDSPLTFDSIQANGLLQEGKLVVQNFDANTMGGVVKGNWLIDWSGGLAMAGEATLERLDCRRVTSVFVSSLWLEGYLTGTLRLRGTGRNWQSMWANVNATLDANILRGALNGVDLAEAARRGAGSIVRAGSTKFDRLSVQVTISPQQVVGRDLLMNAGLFSASGQFVSTRDRQVDSNLMVSMQTATSVQRLPVRVSGTLPNLQAVNGR